MDPRLGCCLGRDNNANKTVWVLKIDAQVHTAKEAVTPAAKCDSAYAGAESRSAAKRCGSREVESYGLVLSGHVCWVGRTSDLIPQSYRLCDRDCETLPEASNQGNRSAV